MGKTSYLLFFFVLRLLVVSGVDDRHVCPYKECTCSQIHILCNNLGLKTLPPLTTTQQTVNIYLSADSNLITTIPAGSLPTGLIGISLMNNPIVTIDEDAFNESSSTLEELSFSNVSFTRIPDAFLHLGALRSLYIYNTTIVDWNIEAIKIIGPNMETLYLENVGVTTWPTWIQYFNRLSELSIIGSSISSIPDDAFDNMTESLLKLSLNNNNNLIAIPKAVSKLSVLEILIAINTNISNLTWLPSWGQLYSLTIDNASISDADHVSNALRPLADSLQGVELQGNQLTKIPDLSFMTRLNFLDLTHNLLYDPVSGSVPFGLHNLDVSYNMLTAIPRVFSNLTYVTSLSLPVNSITALRGTDFPPLTTEAYFEFNLITELTDTSFPQSSSIKFLTLDNNPIAKISEFAFQNLPLLQVLYMQNTKLTRVPVALASLSKIIILDLSGASDLVCTCTEASLGPFISSVSAIDGDCGEISIRFFFDNLSPSCPTRSLDQAKS